DGFDLVGQGVVLLLVEDDFKRFRRLVEALQHAQLGNVWKAQQAVGGGVVDLSAIQQAAAERRHDLAAWQGVDCGTQGGEKGNGKTVGTDLQALQVFDARDRLLEPAKRLCGHGAVHHRHDIDVDGGVQLVQQLLPAAVLVPGQQHVGVHAESGTGREKCQGVLFTVVVAQHAVTAV